MTTRKRPLGALSLCALVGLAAGGGIAARPESRGCDTPAASEHAVIGQVLDGDTVRLHDGRRVRLVGINTPELATTEHPGERFADEARAALEGLAPAGSSVGLAYDLTRRDRYGRTLAFLFGPRGRDVQLVLLERGLASALVVPPRRYAVECYRREEAGARASGLGIWSLERYRGLEAERLPPSARGFYVLRGRVSRVGRSPSALWLQLAPKVAVRIPRKDLVNFQGASYDPGGLLGARIEVRGWVYQRKHERRLTVRHPAALSVLEPS